jgi:hypothetical protein
LARLTSAAPATLITPTGGGQSITVSGEGGRSFTQGGTIPIQQFAWNGSAFAMSTPAAAAVPRSMTALNAAIRKLVATAEPALVPPPYCLTKQGSGRFARAAGDYAAYARSPSLDGATLALSVGLIQELRLGRDAAPDLLEISLPVTARVAGTYGAASEESCLQLFALDRDLGDFLRAVDRMSVPYEVTLTSFPPAS